MTEEKKLNEGDKKGTTTRAKNGTTDRKKRIPVGTRRANLSVSDSVIPKGMVGRWVNDMGNNLQRFLDGGYIFVTKDSRKGGKVGSDRRDGNEDLGSRYSKVVDKTARTNSPPVRAYLMAIPKELYKEDQKAKEAEINKVDMAIRHGKYSVDNDSIEKEHIEYSY